MLLNKQDAIIYFIQKLKESVPYVDVIQKGQSDLILFCGKNVKKIKFLFSKDSEDDGGTGGTSVWRFSPYLNQIDGYDYIVFTTSNSRFSLFDFFIIPNTNNDIQFNRNLKRESFKIKRFDSIFRCDKIENLMLYRDAFNLLNINSDIESDRRFIYTLCIDCDDSIILLNNIDKFNSSSNLIKILNNQIYYNSEYKKTVIIIESVYRVSDISKFIKIKG